MSMNMGMGLIGIVRDASYSNSKELKNSKKQNKLCNLQVNESINVRPSVDNFKAYALSSLNARKISFGRSIEEHNSWGARVNDDNSVSFKVWAPRGKNNEVEKNISRVFVESAPPKLSDNITLNDGLIDVKKDKDGKVIDIKPKKSKVNVIELTRQPDGIFVGKSNHVKVGDNYRFILIYEDGSMAGMKDPYAKRQKGVHSWSTVYDHKTFNWTDSDWQKSGNPKRISRKGTGPLPVIAEVHVGVIDTKGDFDSVKKKIDEYSKEKTFNTIELLPAEGCYFDPDQGVAYNWGYDGVDKLAPAEYYGGPDKLKELVDYAHSKDINMIMDFVPNHMGPHGNYLSTIAPYVGGETGWGDAFNYEGEDNKNVRDYMSNVALNWLENYHFDGLRLDAVTNMSSDYALKQIAKECHFHSPDSYLICENFSTDNGNTDHRLTDPRVVRKSYEYDNEIDKASSYSEKEKIHEKLIDEISNNNIPLDELDYDSQWAFPFFHTLMALTTGIPEGSYNGNLKDFEYNLKNSANNTKYIMSHDEIGNHSGTRLLPKVIAHRLGLYGRVNEDEDGKNWHRVAEASHKLVNAYRKGDDSVWDKSKQEKEMHINNYVSKSEFTNIYNQADSLNRVALTTMFVAPGPKMIFDGDEKGSNSLFKFFAYFDKEQLKKENKSKGYEVGIKSFMESKQDNGKNTTYDLKVKKLTDDLFKLLHSSKALQSQNTDGEHFASYIYNPKIMHIKRKEGDDEILTVLNFSEEEFSHFELKNISKGVWSEVINTNKDEYGGFKLCINDKNINSDDNGHLNIKLPKQSAVIFKKTS